ncbi:hypothetical protein BABINDRAFT_145927 [Babjeviella inositovora NRRL Y-12698]|uniref:MRG domain-containing protein n=1 Tax=Babjeviella inositovora NRRL Y-12698 TaxID=984486 RepID=A0A1E3QRH6_9ASCO|nr:uncharacterized protein BABINDRAFT_145927 [Babjeviella inositovora NRRL Y-12698]ODQ79652.1 hypothetical protein BABINDRAFT_145927 [Babjeviella inositovora NRRL Y-12698]
MPPHSLQINSKCLVTLGSTLQLAKIYMIHSRLKPFTILGKDGNIPTNSPSASFPAEFLTLDCVFLKFLDTGHQKWVAQERVITYLETNLAQKRMLDQNQHRVRKITRTRAKDIKLKVEVKSVSHRAKAKPPILAKLAEIKEEFQVMITLSDRLKHLLLQDYKNVTRHGQLVRLPACVPVSKVISNFSRSSALSADITKSIEVYFNRSLASLVLYDFERQQFVYLKREDTESYSDVYGAIHLLRLLVVLPSLLVSSLLSEDGIKIMLKHMNELLEYMEKAYEKIFSPEDYMKALKTYLNDNKEFMVI